MRQPPDITIELWVEGGKWTVRWDVPHGDFLRTFEGLTLRRAYDEVSDNLLTMMIEEGEREDSDHE